MKIVLLSVVLVLFNIKLVAQEAINDSLIIEEININTIKSGTIKETNPVSSTRLNSRALKEQKIESLKDIKTSVPNFYMPDYGSKLNSTVYIRGIGSKINSPSVGLYVDGVPYFEKSAFDVDLSDVNSIEVIRGPQGTLYGRNTMGGVINISTTSPEFYDGTRIRVSAGNYEQYIGSVSHYGKINDNTYFSLGTSYKNYGGSETNIYDDKKVGKTNDWSMNGRLIHNFSDIFSSDLFLKYEHNEQSGYPYAKIINGEIQPINYNEPSSYKRDMLTTGLSLKWKKDKFIANSVTSYQFLKDRQIVDQDFTPVDLYLVNKEQEQHMISEEFIVKSIKNDNYEWLTGVFGFYQKIDDNVKMKISGGKFYNDQKYDNYTYGMALFHQSTMKNLLVKDLSLTFGARLDYEKTNSEFEQNRTNIGTPTKSVKSSADLDFFEFLPKVSLKYEFLKNKFVYTSVTKGYKTGGFNTFIENEYEKTFDPEKSWNYEAGFKVNLLGEKLYFEGAVFYIDWKDQQVYQLKANKEGAILKNAGKSTSKGVEFSAKINPIKSLRFNFTYGYTEAKFEDYTKGNEVYDNNHIPYIPLHNLSFGANYNWKVNSYLIDKININAQYSGLGKLYWSDANSYEQDFYNTFDARVSFAKENIELSFWVKNIFDNDYNIYSYESLGNNFLQQGKPFTFGADLRINL